MGYTSTAVKRKYNEKTYKRWAVDLRNEDYEMIEKARGELSRSQFLLKLLEASSSVISVIDSDNNEYNNENPD